MSYNDDLRDAMLDQVISEMHQSAKGLAATRPPISVIFSAVDPDRICLITANPEATREHQANGNQVVTKSASDTSRLLANNPSLVSVLDDSAWQVVAFNLHSPEKKAQISTSPAFFETTPPDLPPGLASSRIVMLAQFPSDANRQALCELTEVVMAAENNRSVHRGLFSQESLDAPSWAQTASSPLVDLHQSHQEASDKLAEFTAEHAGSAPIGQEMAQARHTQSELGYLIQNHEDTLADQDYDEPSGPRF